MRYICLIYHDEAVFSRMSASEHEAMQTDSANYDELLASKGQMILAQALRPPATAKRVKNRRRKPVVTDGPFAETKEQLIGFILIEAADMDEALEAAAGIPLAKTGIVEVREVYTFHRGLIRSARP